MKPSERVMKASNPTIDLMYVTNKSPEMEAIVTELDMLDERIKKLEEKLSDNP